MRSDTLLFVAMYPHPIPFHTPKNLRHGRKPQRMYMNAVRSSLLEEEKRDRPQLQRNTKEKETQGRRRKSKRKINRRRRGGIEGDTSYQMPSETNAYHALLFHEVNLCQNVQRLLCQTSHIATNRPISRQHRTPHPTPLGPSDPTLLLFPTP